MANITGHMALCIAAKRIQCKTVQGKLLLLYYAMNADKTGHFYKSYVDAVYETGIAERTIRNYNTTWSGLGFMKTVEPTMGSGKATDYYMDIAAMEKWASNYSDTPKITAKQKGKERVQRWRDKHPGYSKKNPIVMLKEALEMSIR